MSFAVERGERWGVVGRNGTGKTTLFRLITGELVPTAGSVSRQANLRITLLDQARTFEQATTVWDAAVAVYADLLGLERSLAEQADALARHASPEALARYDRDLHRFEREGGHTFRAEVEAVLEGLGFDAAEAKTQRLDGLSGGERGRLGLARQLARPGDLLLLDEPTNHLDLDTTRWLEDWLLTSGHTFLAISHDRAFLDAVADHMLHLEAGTAVAYRSGYADFVRLRAERRAADQRAYELQQRKIAAEEEYIRRNIAGQNTRQAKGRRKRLARLPRLSPPPGEAGAMAVRLEARARGGDQVLVLRDVRLVVNGRVLIDRADAFVRRGEIIGTVGPNGAGKSTLLRAIAGERAVDGGELRLGAGITLAHYRQDLTQVPIDKTLFAAIHDERPAWDRGAVQSHLGRFGFSGDEVQRTIGTLSGGEQARAALALIVLSGANLLLFDEPTNHLDVESIEALEDALEASDATVLLVSHDRALLDAVATRIWAIRDGRFEDFPGTFAEWKDAADRRQAEAAEQEAAAKEEARRREREQARRLHEERQRAAMLTRERRRAVEAAEAHAHALEVRVAELTAKLHDVSLYSTPEGIAEAARLDRELAEARAALDRALEEWAAAEGNA